MPSMNPIDMEPIRERIDVEVYNIKVDDHYYSFDYKVRRNGEVVSDDSYENDYEVHKKEMERLLNNGYAVEIALVQAFE